MTINETSPRPWYRLHLLTWISVCVVGYTLANRVLVPRGTIEVRGGVANREMLQAGWPMVFWDQARIMPKVAYLARRRSPPRWYAFGLLVSAICSGGLLLATTIVCERALRRRHRLQFGLRALFVLGIVLGVMLVLPKLEWQGPIRDFEGMRIKEFCSLVTWSDVYSLAGWPIILALGCAVYLLVEHLWQWTSCVGTYAGRRHKRKT